MHGCARSIARRLFVAVGIVWLVVASALASADAATIAATPNPVLGGPGLGTTTILWDTGDGAVGQVWVALDGGPEALFAQGPSGSQVAPWIQTGHTYRFRLFAGTAHSTVLGSTTVTTGARVWASPMPVAGPTGLGATALHWNTGGTGVGQVWMARDGAPERLFAQGSAGSQAVTWIRSGATYVFTLYAGTSRTTVLDSFEVAMRPSLAASPNPVPAGDGPGPTNVTWNTGAGVGQVWVSANGEPEKLFAQNAAGSQSAPWIVSGNSYRFSLYAGTTHTTLLASTTVTGTSPFSVQLTPVVTGLTRPLFLTHAGDGSGRLYIVQKEGTILSLTAGTPAMFLDVRALVLSSASEQGLLGLAFDPHYVENRRFYVYYTDLGGNTVVARYTALADGTRADPASARVILATPQPLPLHHGGWLGFGPDGYLYVAKGDGGGPNADAQNGAVLLGKMLRIDVASAEPYAIPPDNPFVGVAGMRSEIWSLGLRNPWRPSFDRVDGDLFIADVGHRRYEEINLERAENVGGNNYGWPRMEGLHCFPDTQPSCNQTGLVLPIAEYEHSGGDGGACSVTGGYVYRGAQIPALRGYYLFGDFCSGTIWSLQREGDGTFTKVPVAQLTGEFTITSFGEDEEGELYVTAFSEGVLYRITAAP